MAVGEYTGERDHVGEIVRVLVCEGVAVYVPVAVAVRVAVFAGGVFVSALVGETEFVVVIVYVGEMVCVCVIVPVTVYVDETVDVGVPVRVAV